MRRSRIRVLLLGCACCALMQGCGIAALVAAGSLAGSVAQKERAEWHRINLEREKAGLPALTWEQFRHKAPLEPKTVTYKVAVEDHE